MNLGLFYVDTFVKMKAHLLVVICKKIQVLGGFFVCSLVFFVIGVFMFRITLTQNFLFLWQKNDKKWYR